MTTHDAQSKEYFDRLYLSIKDQDQNTENGIKSECVFDVEKILKLDVSVEKISFENFIELVKWRFELKHIFYFCPTFPGRSLSRPYQLSTYSGGWNEHYKANRYETIDVVLKAGMRSLLPFDWTNLSRKNPRVQKLFSESREFGVGIQGLTIPLRGPVSGVWGMFTATSDESDGAWKTRYCDLLRDLVPIAHYIHQRAYEMHTKNETLDLNTITRRENEALSWSAEGKAVEDIGLLMTISPETVKAHLDSARHKLGALNRVHAVAKAIRAGLIR